jgi:hypothetical protein
MFDGSDGETALQKFLDEFLTGHGVIGGVMVGLRMFWEQRVVFDRIFREHN